MVREQIRARGVDNLSVLEALREVPRDRFVTPEVRPLAYTDHALAIGWGQSISQPYMVAMMTAALDLSGSERVLEVGTGSGYQAAVLAKLAHEVWTIERVGELAVAARATLAELGYSNVHVVQGDGSVGLPDREPFQAILVTAAAPIAPPALLDQLDPAGGRLVVPVGERDFQRVVRVTRHGDELTSERMTACRFVPLIGAGGWAE
jgi:protein-L-isoaspartate(D-aspartate) O-methyltransferase